MMLQQAGKGVLYNPSNVLEVAEHEAEDCSSQQAVPNPDEGPFRIPFWKYL